MQLLETEITVPAHIEQFVNIAVRIGHGDRLDVCVVGTYLKLFKLDSDLIEVVLGS